MTVEEFKLKLEQAKLEILTNDPPLRLASYSTLAAQSKRIFTDGQNSSGGEIGQYNTTEPLYLNPKGTAKTPKPFNAGKLGKPRGKNGQTEFKNGKPHATVYLESYKAYRDTIRRPTDRVNLELSGDLKLDFENPQGNVPTPIQVNTHEYIAGLKRDSSIKKVEGNTKRFGVIFKLTDSEKKLFFDTASFELRRLLA